MMVFVILVETTSPTFSFLWPFFSSAIRLPFLSRGLLRQLALTQNRKNARAGLFHATDLLETVHLAHRHLQPQPEKLLVDVAQLVLQLRAVQIANLLRPHRLPLTPRWPATP